MDKLVTLKDSRVEIHRMIPQEQNGKKKKKKKELLGGKKAF